MLQTARKLDHEYYGEEYQNDMALKNAPEKQSSKKAGSHAFASKFRATLFIIIGFAVCFLILYRYSIITESNYILGQYNKQLEEMRMANNKLRIEVEKNVDLINIEKLAKMRLGMQRPDQYQLIYVRVPRQDDTKVADNDTLEKMSRKEMLQNSKEALLGGIGDQFARLIRFLY